MAECNFACTKKKYFYKEDELISKDHDFEDYLLYNQDGQWLVGVIMCCQTWVSIIVVFQNVLIKHTHEGGEHKLTAVIADFGLAAPIPHEKWVSLAL